MSGENPDVKATGLIPNQKSATIKIGENKPITLTTDPVDASDSAAVLAAVGWTSNDPAIATVDENGVITAVAAGTTKVVATSGSLTVSIDVTVPAATE
ncbi:hypothetical protein FC70_GL001758 [Paucilactobacillus oligofermentans DSM 15707 = LMG 22743]|uniref:BIG2 domain-containing protein n=1 Tax=Paucilactobacillus oligofermentans DSM 15707 = LMG 22743 TaxID=1423778 RepID=A0A0R1RNA5_9LACO|nr:Ig-like domain-containing protein [Paucilactobacillus oligofermentans]KRL54955.1 hypothetical protein FC70_GL001758 [Paucilactobacillus oligofermentans DSM 15707 = LMG 22743]CUS26128.1 Minor capsid protein [Paucilactobacillus oligofermentans DSM 15707 = LMG 22743]